MSDCVRKSSLSGWILVYKQNSIEDAFNDFLSEYGFHDEYQFVLDKNKDMLR